MTLSSLISRLPPVRIIIGASLGLVSYFVTTVWKANIDDDIRTYSNVIERASSIETQLNSLPMFRASSRFWSASIETQRLQIVTLSRLLKGTDKEFAMPPQLSTSNPYEVSAVAHQETVVQEFFGRARPELRELPVKSARFATTNPEYMTRRVGWCIDRVGFEDMTARLAFGLTDTPATSEFADSFAAIYRKRWSGKTSIDGESTTIGTVAAKLAETLAIGHAATQEISKKQFAANPFEPSSEKLTPLFVDQRQRAIQCIEEGEDEVIDDFVSLSTDMRQGAASEFVRPLSDTKRKIERIEIVLYVASGLIALLGSRPSSTERSPGAPEPGNEGGGLPRVGTASARRSGHRAA
jgi:hypothetical protein